MRKYLANHWVPLIILTLLGLWGIKALFAPGFYTSHDGEHQLIRQYIFDRAISAGHFPPKVDRQLLNHLGYPLFTFTYQLPFWIGELAVQAGMTIPNAIKGVFILTYIISGLTMYLFIQDRWGKLAGFVSGFLYLWAPYRFLTIFVRASLGEHVAFLFIPLLFWSVNKLTNPRLRIAIGSIAIAGLLLSHAMVTQMTLLGFTIFWAARIFEEKNRGQFIKHTLKIAILGLGLAAFYLIPAQFYRSAIQGLNRTFYAEHFVTLKQLIYSKWDYAFSILGPNDGMSFQVGIAQWLGVGLMSLLLLLNFKKLKALIISWSFVLSFILSIILMIGISSEIWRLAVAKYFVVDIPWRFLAITTFSSAAIGGILFNIIKNYRIKFLLLIFIFALALYTNRNHLRVNKYIQIDPVWFTSFIGTSNSYDEYKPVHTSERLLKREINPDFEVIKGDAQVNIIKTQPHLLQLTVIASTPSQINLNTTYFPGWEIYVNREKQNLEKNLSDGVPTINLEPGKYNILLEYQQTQVMKLANLISIVSSGIVGGILISPKTSYAKKKKR